MNTEKLKNVLMARACSPDLAAEICAKLDRLADAEAGELKNALACGQACIELSEERKDNERLLARIAQLESKPAAQDVPEGYRLQPLCEYEAMCAVLGSPEDVARDAELRSILEYVEGEMEAAYHNAGQRCCRRGVVGAEYMGSRELVCCGNPEPTWSKEDQAVMDKLAPVQSRLHAMLAAAPTAPASDKKAGE